ncbi:MAG: alanine--glyoxylate aminotransferase family protein [Candidatus Latescibacteria bacterium]|nr:alanine--glyoxylate aminotransferase family protein [Candidatus Latescibacterota bacterium]
MIDQNKILLTPGPVPIPPYVLEALARPMIHHRGPEFARTLETVRESLKQVFRTSQPVLIMASTGSGAMEAAMVNILRRGDRVLVINSGKFGERWSKMAAVYGLRLLEYCVPWGEAADLGKIDSLLKEHPDCKAVFCQACETSTGTVHPIREIAELTAQLEDGLFVVDAITALGTMDLPMDEWHIDVMISGAQKAFMLPPGISFIAMSERAQGRIQTSDLPVFYFDLKNELKAYRKGETYFSSPVTHIRALEVVLPEISGANMEKRITRCRALMNFTHKVCRAWGLTLYSKNPASGLTAVAVPDQIDGQHLRDLIEDRYHVTFMGGQDQLKGRIIRVGHIGYITDDDIKQGMMALGSALRDLGYGISSDILRDAITTHEVELH